MCHCLIFWCYVWYCIVQWFVFLCVKHMQWFSQNFVCLKRKRGFKVVVQLVVILFQQNSSSLPLYSLPSSDTLVLKHYYALHLSWLLNMCSRVTLLACRNSSKLLFLFLFIIYPKHLLILISSALMHPHLWDLPLLTMKGKDMLSINPHSMGGIYKEGWHWDFLINFSSLWLQNLTSYWLMLGHRSHYAVIIA